MEQRVYRTNPKNNSYTLFTNKPLHISSVGSSVLENDSTNGYENPRNYYRLYYLYYGDVSIKTDKKQFPLKSGQLIIFPPNTPFTYEKLNKGKTEFLWLNFTGLEAKDLIKSVFLQVNTPIDVGIPLYVFEAFETLYAEYETRTPFFDTALTYKLMHIMVLFGRAAARLDPAWNIRTKGAINLGLLTTSLAYINNNYTENITTEALADMEHMSVSHFRRLFKTKTSMTPTQYITIVRLKFAEELLRKTDMNIKQIAEAVGYDNQLYFSKLFSNHFGKSPKSYRLDRDKTKGKQSKIQ